MALQIGLPGQGGISKLTIGIDLGTTNSLVATVKDNTPIVLADPQGRALVPSVVSYADGAVLVGHDAQDVAISRPHDTIISVKRLMGRSSTDPEVQATAAGHTLSTGEGGIIRIHTDGREITPVEVSAEILRKLKSQAEKVLKRRVTNVVITVPAYFDDAQRQATRDAGRLAGLEVMRLLNEPTAAALAYGLDQANQGTYAVYDLGGGTFDISILKLEGGVFEVLSTGGNTHLGGDDLDDAVAQVLLAEAGYPTGDAPSTSADAETSGSPLDASIRRMARKVARKAKEDLTGASETTIELPRFGASDTQPLPPYSRTLTRAELETLTRPIIERTGPACQAALVDANLKPGQLDGVVLVGGSTRMPLVQQYVAEVFGREPFTGVDPDQVVALGAAIQAALLAGWQKDVLLLDVNPLSLGLETMGGIVEKLIHRNSTIPASAQQVFTTFADGQTAMDIHVLQGERELAKDCRSLARFTLRGIPPLPAGVARIAVTFQIDTDGILRVSAREERTGVEQRIEVRPSYGLSDGEVERMLKEALENAQADVSERLLLDARIESERILNALETALEADGERLLSSEERKTIEEVAQGLRESMAGTDHHAMRDGIERLDRASLTFAQRRMEQGLVQALAGQNLESLEEELKDAPTGKHHPHH